MARHYDLSGLCESIRQARLALEYPRANRVRMVRALAGPEWSSETSADPPRPVNLIDLYVKVVSPNLISQNPRVLLSTFEASGKPAVAAMQFWMNQEIERSNFCETMQRVVTDALFNIGIIKVGLAAPMDAAASSWALKAGQPYVESIDLDDFVFDIHARKFADAAFMAHRVRRPLEAVKNDPKYSKARKKLQPSRDPFYNQEGDQRINVLGRGYWGNASEEFEDMVDLWEVYLPRERVVICMAAGEGGNPEIGDEYDALREDNWLGPDEGPYHILGYGITPGNPMPRAPIPSLIPLDGTVNGLYRKLIRQAERQKEILGVQGSADADGNRIINAPDGEAIRVDNPEAMKPLSFGGPNAMNFQMADHLKQLFSYMACNMDAAGGLSPQAKTFGQDKMLTASASRVISDMQSRTVAYTARVLKALAWYHWEHPFNEMGYEHQVRGLKKGYARTLYPRQVMGEDGTPQNSAPPEAPRRDLPFSKLDLRVDPYSIQPQSPESRLGAMNQVVTQIVIPMMTLLQQQGIGFDINAYLQKVGTYLDMPDLADILTIQAPPEQTGPGGDGGGPKMPANTTRTYQRESVPMRSDRGASQQLQAHLSGVQTGGAQRNGQAVGVGS